MLADMVHLPDILVSLETTLRIDYSETTVEKILDKALRSLSEAYQRDFTEKTVYEIMAKSMVSAESMEILCHRIMSDLASLSFYESCTTFKRRSDISLARINFLGYTAPALRSVLKYLQFESAYEEGAMALPAIIQGCNNLAFCEEKRLFIILLLLDRLGLREGVNVVARFLHIGGLEL